MDGRDFLAPARAAAAGASEAFWRAAVVHAYYALVLECRDALLRWGRSPPPRHAMHATVRLSFTYATDKDLKQIGIVLDRLSRDRNRASYDLSVSGFFASSQVAKDAVQQAADALALLDAIEGDPARRAAAIASLPP